MYFTPMIKFKTFQNRNSDFITKILHPKFEEVVGVPTTQKIYNCLKHHKFGYSIFSHVKHAWIHLCFSNVTNDYRKYWIITKSFSQLIETEKRKKKSFCFILTLKSCVESEAVTRFECGFKIFEALFNSQIFTNW